MRTTTVLVAVLMGAAGGAVAQSTPAPAKPAPIELNVPHGYVGLAAARTIFSIQDDSMQAPGATESTLNSGKNEWGYRFFAGYRFHRNVSIEGAVTDFGKFTATREITQPVTGNLIGQTRVVGASVDLVGWLPFNNGFSFIGKIGGMYATTQTYYYTEGNYTLPPGSKNYVRNSEFVGRYGLGLAYALTDRVTLRAEYEVSPKVGEEISGDLKAGFVSVQVRF